MGSSVKLMKPHAHQGSASSRQLVPGEYPKSFDL